MWLHHYDHNGLSWKDCCYVPGCAVSGKTWRHCCCLDHFEPMPQVHLFPHVTYEGVLFSGPSYTNTYTQNSVLTEAETFLMKLSSKDCERLWWTDLTIVCGCVCIYIEVSPKLLDSECATLRGTGLGRLFKLIGLNLALPLRHTLVHLKNTTPQRNSSIFWVELYKQIDPILICIYPI